MVTIGDVLFADNIMDNMYYGIYIYGYSSSTTGYTQFGDFVFLNNTADTFSSSWLYAYTRYGTMENVTFKNNSLNSINSYGIYIYGYQTSSVSRQSFQSLTFEDNDFNDIQNYATYFYVYYGGSGETNIHRNTFNNVYSRAIYLYGYRGTYGNINITENEIDGVTYGYGFYIYAGSGTVNNLNVQRNIVQNTDYDGMYFSLSSTVLNQIRVNNNTVVNCDDGIRLYTSSGSSQFYTVQNNTIVSNYYSGIYISVYNGNHAPLVEHNQIVNNMYGMQIDAYNGNLVGGRLANNTMIKNDYGLTIWEDDDLRIEHNIINSNNQRGLDFYGDSSTTIEQAIYNNVITNNKVDIYLEEGVNLRSFNNTFDTVQANIGWNNQNPKLMVMGTLDVQVMWEDGSGPVADAELQVFDVEGNNLLDDRTDNQGTYNGIDVILFTVDPDGTYFNTPFTVNASKYGIMSSTAIEGDSYTSVVVYLDNVPPEVLVYSPEEMMVTAQSTIKVAGQTEIGTYLTINGVEVMLTPAGTFEFTVDLPKEGNNDVSIEARDQFNNTRTILLHILRDTVPPTVEIMSLEDGFSTNSPALTIVGETEPGALVKVNEHEVPVNDIGMFEYKVLLAEGENVITIVIFDEAGNTVAETRTVMLDSVPPTINVLTPTNGLITNTEEIDIRGTAPGADSLKVNGLSFKILGETFVSTYKLQLGTNVLLFEAWDEVGNYASFELTVTLDQDPPALQVISPKDNLFTGNEILVVSGSAEIENVVTVNGVQVTLDPNNGLFSYTLLLKEGTNRVVVRSVDEIGNTIEVVRNVFLDTMPPLLTVTSPVDDLMTIQPKVTVEGIVEVNSELTINGEEVAIEQSNFKKVLTLDEGENRIVIIATDRAGNRIVEIREVSLDTMAEVQIFTPVDGLTTDQENITFTGRVEVGSSLRINGIDIEVDNEDRFTRLFALDEGSNDFEIVVTDGQGNVNTVYRTVIFEDVSTTPTNKAEVESDSSIGAAWLWAALIGALIGAVVAAGTVVFAASRLRRQDGPAFVEPMEEGSEGSQDQHLDDEDLPPPEPPEPPKPPEPEDNGNGGPRLVPPPFIPVKEDKNIADTAAESEMAVDENEIEALTSEVDKLEEQGEDMSKARQSLRMAGIYLSRNRVDRASKHLRKAKLMLRALDKSSSEVEADGGETEFRSTLPPPPTVLEDTSPAIPKIPPPPKLDDDPKVEPEPAPKVKKVRKLKKVKKKKPKKKAEDPKGGDA
jgi:hypothetical protein